MLNRFLRLLGRFQSDERGAFLVIFGVMAIVLVATSGAVVDFSSVEQARTRAQVALDAVALGLQPRIYDKPAPSEEQLRLLAENVLRERMTARDVTWSVCATSGISTLPCVRVESAETDTTDGSIRLRAIMELPMAFVSLVGVESMRARLVAEATRKRLNIEVAMVLDNSGSMSQANRMGHLKAAANCAVNVLLRRACDPGPADPSIDNVKIGIVPFTEFVNVGTNNRNASWMDRTGASKVARDNFDNDDNEGTPFAGPIDRLDLYDNLTNVGWKGCVEARNHTEGQPGVYYDTSDLPPNSSIPDSLFAPAFAPDEPDSGSFPNNYLSDTPAACGPASGGECKRQDIDYYCNSRWQNCGGSYTNYQYTAADGTVTNGPNACSCDGKPITSDETDYYSNYGYYKVRMRTCGGGGGSLTPRELQERICKYTGGINTRVDGPNVDCPNTALLPLTDSLPTIKMRIGSMRASGGTNIHQGVMWGFHMLSPTEPLTEGRPYDSATSKVMIVMTDGENTHAASGNMNGSHWYTAYGYPYNERLGEVGDSTAELQVIMDTRTTTTCTNAKLAGITIYTIGLSAPNQKTKDMLTACASSAGKAHFPTDPSQLKGVFTEIADELSKLRLAQ